MKRSLLYFILFLTASSAASAAENILAITHVTLIDTTGARVKPDTTVVITGDHVTAIGKSTLLSPPTNADVINATGKFLIPGLWDMHVHWYEEKYLPLFIANGVTGIRMMWGFPMHNEWRKRIKQGSLLGPRMFLASTLVDGPDPIWPGSFVASNEAEGRKAVQKAKEDAADFVKVYSLLPRRAYFAIADEAHKRGIPFAGHVPMAVSVKEASVAGQKSIEHLTGILSACSSRDSELLRTAQEYLAERSTTNYRASYIAYSKRESATALDTYSADKAARLFSLLKKNHTWQCPTFTVLRLITAAADSSITNDARVKYMPPELQQEWRNIAHSRFKTGRPEDVAFGREYFQKHLEVVGAMKRAGVGILAGTDTGNPFCMPGFSLHDELGFLVRAGLTPMQALQAATLNAAQFMGRENELGTIAKNKLADLVLLDANPLDDITNTRKISAVIYNGRYFSRPMLDEMLARIESLASGSESNSQRSSQTNHENKTGFHLD